MTNQYAGVWQTPQVQDTTLSGNTFSGPPGARLFYAQPAPGRGYLMVGRDGGVFSFGDAGFYGSTGNLHLNAPIIGLSQTRDQGGYVMAAADGGAFNFGDASFYGSVPGSKTPLTSPVVGVVTTPVVAGPPGTPGTNGLGYWLVGSDGNVYPFGHDAKSYGSLVGQRLNQPVVGMAPTPDGLGYWLVGRDGGVYSFGDAGFYGSMGGAHLSAPITTIVSTPDGHGYWLVGRDSGVFSFGDAGFYGSTGNLHLNAPVVSMSSTPDGHGYWLTASDGGVFNFGDAGFYGSTGGTRLNAPVVGAAAEGVLL